MGFLICRKSRLMKVKLYYDSIEALQLIFARAGNAHPLDLQIEVRSLVFTCNDLEVFHVHRESFRTYKRRKHVKLNSESKAHEDCIRYSEAASHMVGQSLPEVVISDNDFLISCDGDIPTIDFSKEVRDVLAREARERGRYAQIAVLVDLQKPLVPWIKVDGRMYGVEYEGLPLICFECGRIGHAKEKCPLRKLVAISVALVSEAILVDGSPGGESEGERSKFSGGRLPEPGAAPFGEWMQAPIKENGGRYKEKGIGSGIVRNSTAELVSKEAESPTSVKRKRKHSQIKPKVRVQEYRIKPHQEGPSSITKPNSMEVLISPSGPSTLAGDVVMDKSLWRQS
ncbi:hypothetical protein K1719_012103 [Acacia pycnantha]|nr:hypothetical protein K1719_012103 [Acacia pycnantha]